jgi:hypothetical protein
MPVVLTSGCSMLLSQPMNKVSHRRGIRLVNRKLKLSHNCIRAVMAL